jgi:hypothetical protein
MKSELAFMFPPKAKATRKPRAKSARTGARVTAFLPGSPIGKIVGKSEVKGRWNVQINGEVYGLNRTEFKVMEG